MDKRYKLKQKIKNELKSETPSVDNLIGYFNEFENHNLETIKKLKRERLYEAKRISGALRSTIDAHSVITKELIGSATKRILGSVMVNNTKNSIKRNTFFNIFVITILAIITLLLLNK